MMVKEGQVYRWCHEISCRDGSTLPEGSTITVIKRTNFNPHNEIGPAGHNWLCDAANGRTVWATLEACILRRLCDLVSVCEACMEPFTEGELAQYRSDCNGADDAGFPRFCEGCVNTLEDHELF